MINEDVKPKQEPDCKACKDNRYRVIQRGDLSIAETCPTCFAMCPECYDVGFSFIRDERGYRYARPCHICGPLRTRIQRFNDAHIPSLYANKTLENLEPGHIPNSNLPEIRGYLWRWSQGYTPGDQGFLLVGVPGCGKTHAMVGVLRTLTLDKGITARFVEFTHLLSALRTEYDHGRGDAAIVGSLIDVDVLAIDELGKGADNDWQRSVLDELITKRYNHGKTTVFTTNYPLKDTNPLTNRDIHQNDFGKRATALSLPARVGPRIFSRLHEMASFMTFNVPDYRASNAPDGIGSDLLNPSPAPAPEHYHSSLSADERRHT